MCFQVEHVVREENTMAAYDLLEIYCELIVTRLPIIESQKYVADKLNHSIKEFIFFYFIYFCVVWNCILLICILLFQKLPNRLEGSYL